jgi:glucose-1-phosphate cytidylyltransferase
MTPANVPVFILAGGLGTRLKEQTEFRPKPMLEIGHRPILWHIIRWYGHFGFRKFIICAGFRSEVIKDYFLNYSSMNSDFTVDLSTGSVSYHDAHHDENYQVTVAYTGELTMTGGRIGRAASKYIGNAEHFAITYGDGLTDANLREEFDFHVSHGRIGTVLAINPPSRFGEILVEGDTSLNFSEKPNLSHSWINGGYFFFRRDFTKYLSTDENLVLEKQPLMQLSADRELQVFRHDRFWACMDTQRDKEMLEELWNSGKAPWAVPPKRALVDKRTTV